MAEKSHWAGKLCYAYGTSLTSESWGKYIPFLQQLSEMKIVNLGIPAQGLTNLGGCSTGQTKAAVMNLQDGKEQADLILLEVGANEGGEIGDIFDLGDDTFCGCLNQCLRYLLQYTCAQIAVIPSVVPIAPPWERKDYYQRLLKTEEVCKINRVHFLGFANGLGQARIFEGQRFVWDNIHQTELGGKIWAQSIWSVLKNTPLFCSDIP